MPNILSPGMIVHHRYRLIQLIGQGGMGAVYAAIDQTFSSQVALKQLFPTPNLSPQQVADMERAFRREAHLLHQLRHPALPRVNDYFADSSGHFLVMDYIEGTDLATLLEQRQQTQGCPLTEAEVVPWAIQVLGALEYLHTQTLPIIHRDIKPHNIKLTVHGEIFLIDFGIAKGPATPMTVDGQASVYAYTLAYAPLEQIRGTGTEPRSDLFSLGATMYHLLTGSALDQPPRCDALMRATTVLSNAPDPLTLPSRINPAVQQVLLQALALAPNHRPTSATEMRQALQAAISSPSINAYTEQTIYQHPDSLPPTPLEPAAVNKIHPVPPPKRTLWFMSGVVVLLILGLLGATVLTDFNLTGWLYPLPPKPTNTPVVATPTKSIDVLTHLDKIVFESNRAGKRDIYVMNADGTDLQQLTNNQAQNSMPIWSPKGTHIAFVSEHEGNTEIYMMNADGTDLKNLTRHEAYDNRPAWSPDGRHIAFVSERDGNAEIYVISADGTDLQRLTNNQMRDSLPIWSPDGTRIAFVSERDNNIEIYVMNTDGTNPQNLTNHPAYDNRPVWSPDGTRIAFVSEREGNWEIYVMNADGTDLQRLTNHPADDYSPVWSPDGTHIAFVSERDGNIQIYMMNADSTDLQRLTNERAFNPIWSSDGTRIAFVSERQGNREIYVMNADGSNPQNLTNHEALDWYPNWSP